MSAEHRVWMRMRMAPADARYAGGLVDGGRILQLFGDLATELSVVVDGDEGLFCAYDSVEFLGPVHSGDFIEATAAITRFGNTSRQMSFEAHRRIAPAPHRGETAADLLAEPEILVRASGTVVVPRHRQRRLHHGAVADQHNSPRKIESREFNR